MAFGQSPMTGTSATLAASTAVTWTSVSDVPGLVATQTTLSLLLAKTNCDESGPARAGGDASRAEPNTIERNEECLTIQSILGCSGGGLLRGAAVLVPRLVNIAPHQLSQHGTQRGRGSSCFGY